MSEEMKNKPPIYSVRTNDEVMTDVTALVERTGLNQKDLFSAMVTQFKTNLMANSNIEQTVDMQQLRYHLSHAESIFTNMVQKLHDIKENFTESIEQEKNIHQGVVDQVEKSRILAESERDKAKLDLLSIHDQLNELSERNNELEAVNKSNRITIELLTSQNEAMNGRIGTVAEMENKIQELRIQHADNQRQLERLQAESLQNVRILELTKERLVSAEKESEKSITSAQKVADLQVHAANIEASNRVLEATTKIKDEYSSKIDTLQDRIQTLTTLVHELELSKTKAVKREKGPSN